MSDEVMSDLKQELYRRRELIRLLKEATDGLESALFLLKLAVESDRAQHGAPSPFDLRGEKINDLDELVIRLKATV